MGGAHRQSMRMVSPMIEHLAISSIVFLSLSRHEPPWHAVRERMRKSWKPSMSAASEKMEKSTTCPAEVRGRSRRRSHGNEEGGCV